MNISVGSAIRAALLAIALLPACLGFAQAQAPMVRQEIERRIAAAPSTASANRLRGIAQHYAGRGYEPLWTENGTPSAKAYSLVEALSLAHEDGLRPEDYGLSQLSAWLGETDEATLAALEVQLSVAAVAFAQHMNAGRVDPRELKREIQIYPQAISAAKVLGDITGTRNLKAYFRLLAPHTPRYERLRTALGVYRRIAESGGWTQIPEGPVLRPGASDPRVPLLRRRMIEAGLYRGSEEGGNVYDTRLQRAVADFQDRMGIAVDAIVGQGTLAEMNLPVEERIATMELNLERNRWMQNDFGEYHLFANLADQVIKLVHNEDTILAERIQVGLPYHSTPVFSDEVEYIEFNPYWNVPPSIAFNEYLPRLREDPGVLRAENISLLSAEGEIDPRTVNWSAIARGHFPYRLRQKPGPNNALGRVKFMFPNQYNVYLHDTPAQAGFDSEQRYFSHGCLRLRDPLKLAELLLAEQGWDRQRIDAVVASGERTVVHLERKMPIHIVYLTSWVNKDGSVWFRKDVYERDKALAEALAKLRGL